MSRLHGRTPLRVPGGMWGRGHGKTTATPTIPTPPSILVSPPAADVEGVIRRSEAYSYNLRAVPIRHEWQFAFISTVLMRDQLAVNKLQWQLDLIFAAFACSPARDEVLVHRPHLATRLAHQAARQTTKLLKSAWKPSSTCEYLYSPPSFRCASITRETSEVAPDEASSAHAIWAQRISGILGTEIAEKLTRHVVETIRYMTTWYAPTTDPSDPQRGFSRPCMMAQFCALYMQLLQEWHEEEMAEKARKLPLHHVCAGAAGSNVEPVYTSVALRRLFVHTLQTTLEGTLADIKQPLTPVRMLQVPGAGTGSRTLTTMTPPRRIKQHNSASVIDAARFVGELFRAGVVVDRGIVASWLAAFLLTARTWIDVPMYELEAACALLLLVGPMWHNAQLLDGTSLSACSLHDNARDHTRASRPEDPASSILNLSMQHLEELAQSTLVPEVTKEWVQVRNWPNLTKQGVLDSGRQN